MIHTWWSSKFMIKLLVLNFIIACSCMNTFDSPMVKKDLTSKQSCHIGNKTIPVLPHIKCSLDSLIKKLRYFAACILKINKKLYNSMILRCVVLLKHVIHLRMTIKIICFTGKYSMIHQKIIWNIPWRDVKCPHKNTTSSYLHNFPFFHWVIENGIDDPIYF